MKTLNLYLLVLNFAIFFLSCKTIGNNFSEIKSCEVYAINLGASFPKANSREDLLQLEPYFITDEKKLYKIGELIKTLEKEETLSEFIPDVYILCRITSKNGGTAELLYNKFQLKLDGKIYKSNSELIGLIYPSSKSIGSPTLGESKQNED